MLIERLTTAGTRMTDSQVSDCLRNLALDHNMPYDAADNPSMLSLLHFNPSSQDDTVEASGYDEPRNAMGLDNINFEAIVNMFDTSRFTSAPKRFPANLPIYLLWADALASFAFFSPHLTKLVQHQVLRRARYEGMAQAILALT
jgi:hypothetical protein